MTNGTVVSRGMRVAALVALFSLVAIAAPVRAATSIDIEARALVAGRYEVGGWLALAVTLVNDGEPTEGYLSSTTEIGSVRRFVEMPAGAHKVVMLYVQPEAFQREVTVTYDEPNGAATTTVQVSVLEQSAHQVAVVGDGTGTLRPQLMGSGDVGVPEPIALAPADIPERPEPLDGFAGIVWAGDSSSLNEAQRQSLDRWVADGGQLIVLGGADWQARTAAFTDMLPLNDLAGTDNVSQDGLAAWSGEADPPVAAATASTGTLRPDSRALVTSQAGEILASMRPIGAGRVILVGSDLATPAYRGWAGSPRLWMRLLPSNALLEQFLGGGFPMREEIDSSMRSALETLPTLAVPPAELLLGVIVAYILLIGPISYVVLRRIDRRELAWVTAPILVVLFSACSFGLGRALKGSDVVVNQISLIRSTSAGGAATIDTYAGIYSPSRATYDVTVEADALLGPMRRADGLPETGTADVTIEQGNPAQLGNLAIGALSLEAVRASGLEAHEPALSVTWSGENGDIVGTVTNSSDQAISDVAYVSGSGGVRIGDLAPGGSAEFKLPGANFNGSRASDQVYGFGGFDNGSDEQRRLNLRRNVIDALVGQIAVTGDGGLGGRGPYVIGWLDEEGPMPIAVEGPQMQRHASSVEVLSVRPSIGTGQITIQPRQMGVAILSVEGDATPAGFGMVTLGDGSATYSVALPLETTGMAISGVEIVAGSDPSMMIDNPGNVGGFWPEGFTIEVRDPRSGEWTMLGDLSLRSQFEISDPATAVSDTGRIDVRVHGVDGNPQFGQQNVFISARVTGVLDE